ncbi:MAG: GntR family transcriptional regulator [Lentisphaerae bacterium]|nr:GntR family transcriptional regulator [Lentisphaerota bacterium]
MTKIDEILDVLRKELESGHYKPGSKFASEHKLMLRFNASRPTINKVTTQLVAERLLNRGPKGAGTFVAESFPFPIGHLAYLGSINSLYHSRILNGLQMAAFQKNYAVSIFSPGAESINHVLDKIANSDFRGLLVSNIGLIPSSFTLPVVYVDNGYDLGGNVKSSVTCTNYKGAADMTEKVLSYGHREILIYTSYGELEISRAERVRGFRDTLEKHGIKNVQKRVFHEAILDLTSIKFMFKKMMKLFPETTAIMVDSDNIANKLLQAKALLMPERKLCITGFGNVEHSCGQIKFPSVEQHPEEIGMQSVNELLNLINDPDYISSGKIEIETELVNMEEMTRP